MPEGDSPLGMAAFERAVSTSSYIVGESHMGLPEMAPERHGEQSKNSTAIVGDDVHPSFRSVSANLRRYP